MTEGWTGFEEPASTFLRYRWVSLAMEVISACAAVALVVAFPWFFPRRPSGVELVAELVAVVLVLPVFAFAILSGCIRILRRQRYRVTPAEIRPTNRPLAVALRRGAYVIRPSDLSEVWSRTWEFGTPSFLARLSSGELVDITPPYGHKEGYAALDAFLRDNRVEVHSPRRGGIPGVRDGDRTLRTASIAALWIAWFTISLGQAYLALAGGFPPSLPIIFTVSTGVIVGLWTITVRSLRPDARRR